MARSRTALRHLTPVLLTVLYAWQAAGCATLGGAAGGDSASEHAPLFLWEVTPKDERPGRAYLYGSVHLLPENQPPVDRAVTGALAASSDLAFEADPSPEAAAAVQHYVQGLASYAPGDGLHKHAPAELVEKTIAVTSDLGIPQEAVMRLKPWILNIYLQVHIADKLGFEQRHGTEQWTLRAAGGARPIHELEGARMQIDIIAGMAEHAQLDQLRWSVENIEKIPTNLEEILAHYNAGDVESLRATTFDQVDELASGPLMLDTFFYRRNAHMANVLDDLLTQEKTYFVVVGSGHLIGHKSMRTYLEEKGYEIRRVEPQGSEDALAESPATPAPSDPAARSPQQEFETIEASLAKHFEEGDLVAAVNLALTHAIQVRAGDRILDGFDDEHILRLLEPICEPLEWLGQWGQASACWTKVITLDERSKLLDPERRILAHFGARLAAVQLGQMPASRELFDRVDELGEPPTLSPQGQARVLSLKAQSLQNFDPASAFESAVSARAALTALHPPEHPGHRPVLSVIVNAGYFLGRSAELTEQADALVNHLKTTSPHHDSNLLAFTLMRAVVRAEAGDKKGARADLDATLPELRSLLPPGSPPLTQLIQGAAKTYIRIGAFSEASKLLEETGAALAKSSERPETEMPVLVADQHELEGRLLVAKRKKKAGIASMRAGIAYAEKRLADQPVAVGSLQCRLAQVLGELKREKRAAKKLRAAGIEGLKTGFPEHHPILEQCAHGTLPW